MSDAVHDYLSGLIGQEYRAPRIAREPVSASAIHSWCDAMSELGPLYHSPESARAAGFRDVVAPPAMLQVWTMPGLEPGRPPTAGPSREGDLDETIRKTLDEMGFPSTLATSTAQRFLETVQLDDVISEENVLVRCSNLKTTSLGDGYFVTSRQTYRTAVGVAVGEAETTVLHFRPPEPVDCSSPTGAEPPPPLANLGESLVSDPIHISPTLIVAGAIATRDYYPVHHDRDFAQASGSRDILMNILTTNGLIARVVGEWTSQARLESLTTRLRSSLHPNEQLSIHGTLNNVGAGLAELTLSAKTASAVHAEATALVRAREG